jgi:hypothetical protein
MAEKRRKFTAELPRSVVVLGVDTHKDESVTWFSHTRYEAVYSRNPEHGPDRPPGQWSGFPCRTRIVFPRTGAQGEGTGA